MAYSMWVHLQRDQLLDVQRFSKSVRDSEFPLTIDTDWDWESHIGWLPAYWDGEESGCEIELESLEREDIESAEAAGFKGLDSAVVLTTRGMDSLNVAIAIAACLAQECDAVVSEDEGQYIAGADVIDWARRGIFSAEQIANEKAQHAGNQGQARAESPDPDDADTLLFNSLHEAAGYPITSFMLVGDGLSIQLEGGFDILGRCWRLHHDGRDYDVTRYRKVRQQQARLLLTASDDKDWEKQADALESELEAVRALDHSDMESAFEVLKPLAGQISVSQIEWVSAKTIEVTLSTREKTVIEFSTGDYLPGITVRAGELYIDLNNEGARVIHRNQPSGT